MASDPEATKDTLQIVTEQAAEHVGAIATIITAAVRDIAKELGNWLTDVVEMREATQRAKEDPGDSV